jgi:hypothetical protein
LQRGLGGFFSTKGTKVFVVLLIKTIEHNKSDFSGFIVVGDCFVPRKENLAGKFLRSFASIQYLCYLAPIEMKIRNVPIFFGTFLIVMDSGNDVYYNAQALRY